MDFDKQLVERFFQGSATHQEAEKVLNWFETEEGQKYLSSRFNEDVEQIEEIEESFETSPEAYYTLERIKAQMAGSNTRVHKKSYYSSAWAVAAGLVFLIAVVSVLEIFYGSDQYPVEETNPVTAYSTDADEQRRLMLSDGTVIRLNEQSRIEIPHTFTSESRIVQLEGEAFFEVTSDSIRPFIVEAGEAEIRVLGTAFSVKTAIRLNQTIVAVSKGRVSLGILGGLPENHKVLEENMLGLLNTETQKVTKEDMNIHNYLSWMHGRVLFNKTPFGKVVRQLQHIYDIDSELQHEKLLDMRLTADFSERSLENVLTTIAHSLGIEVKQDGNVVKWSLKESN